jgi:hypothetical protein
MVEFVAWAPLEEAQHHRDRERDGCGGGEAPSLLTDGRRLLHCILHCGRDSEYRGRFLWHLDCGGERERNLCLEGTMRALVIAVGKVSKDDTVVFEALILLEIF